MILLSKTLLGHGMLIFKKNQHFKIFSHLFYSCDHYNHQYTFFVMEMKYLWMSNYQVLLSCPQLIRPWSARYEYRWPLRLPHHGILIRTGSADPRLHKQNNMLLSIRYWWKGRDQGRGKQSHYTDICCLSNTAVNSCHNYIHVFIPRNNWHLIACQEL